MVTTMDRYEADWEIVARGWRAHVHGDAERFRSAREAIRTFYDRDPRATDQFLPPFVVADEAGAPVGRIVDGDGVVFFNFRGDRAIEISRAFESGPDFAKFDRGPVPDVLYAGLMQYDGDYGIPKNFLVDPPRIERTMGEFLARNGVRQFACSETQKYGHVTYFWNGNRGGKFDEATERYLEIPSDRVPFEQRPWMKAAEVTDACIQAIGEGWPLIRLNWANGDMVGHSGVLRAAIVAVEAVDLCLERLLRAVAEAQGVALVLADHGNADEMYEWDAKRKDFKRDATGRPMVRTAHSLNPVPCILYDPVGAAQGRPLALRDDLPQAGLSNVAATALNLLGFAAPDGFDPSLLAVPAE
jgi:2,3-bisphosphoglycerate-independent phosphoglycerate mutase